MCWAYKKDMTNKYLIFLCLAICFTTKAGAQNVSSPYSILGIGDIENNDFGRYSASGGAAVSRREPGSYNFLNPASLTAIPYKTVNFDFGFRGKLSQYKIAGVDTLTSPTKDFVLKRITIAFKVTPKTALAFGLKPFSTVNYQYTSTATVSDGAAEYLKFTEGSGGINQFYVSVGKELKSRLSVGATASWLFGSTQNSIQYYNYNLGLDISRNEANFYTAAGLQAGLQYYSLPVKEWQHTAGITAAAYTSLKGQQTAEYQENSIVINTLDPESIAFKMPVSLSAGYSIANKQGVSFHLQGDYHNWAERKLDYKNSYIKDAYALRAGFEYSKKNTGQVSEDYYLALGVKMQQSYLVLNNNRLNDYTVTMGGGKNLSRMVAINAGVEIGKKGSSSLGQIQENYYQFNLGFTLKDIWFGSKNLGRFR